MIFGTIKNYLIGILSALAAVLAFGLKWSGSRRKQAEARADQADAINEHNRKVSEADIEIEEKFRSRRAEAKDEIKKTGGASTFRNPNKLRDKKRH